MKKLNHKLLAHSHANSNEDLKPPVNNSFSLSIDSASILSGKSQKFYTEYRSYLPYDCTD